MCVFVYICTCMCVVMYFGFFFLLKLYNNGDVRIRTFAYFGTLFKSYERLRSIDNFYFFYLFTYIHIIIFSKKL